ncbi:MAG: copper-binding protein [bacterium]
MTASRQLRRRSANAARLALVLVALALLIGPAANAQSSRRTKKQQLSVSQSAPVPTAAAEPALPPAGARGQGEGEVRRIDKSAGKITIRHGEITGLGMPPMLMVFRVQDPATLTALKAGDRITFIAGVINGMLTVVSYEMAK